MKKHIPTAIAIVACILVVTSLFQISELKRQLRNTEDNMVNQLLRLDNSIGNIYSNIDSMLNEQAKLIASSNWDFGDIDIDAKLVSLRCTVSPKEYRPDTTLAVLICNNTEYPMTLKNGEYVVDLSIPLIRESHVSHVQLIDDGTVRTEELDWYLSPRDSFLPEVNAHFQGGGTGSPKDGIFKLKQSGDIAVNVYHKDNSSYIQSITMYEYMDGKEIAKREIPLNTVPTPTKTGMPTPEPATRVYPDGEAPSDFFYYIDNEYSIPYGSMLEVYVEVVDNNGLRYRVLVIYYNIDANGNPVEDADMWRGMTCDIYDKNGNVLWEEGKEVN